ncbi:TPR-like protein [Bimuria novae-zelandiae CBS 107.79]|uniref:TPR-like protein n=1 Tax=Bimuria novae-zelandiae CBS 107.79 TaxID=1447943 RepID=A0A6A5V9R3_9PLEO|nr:TPR-like protein [Bimuria novae-zelandiae CBS 107.79]
MSPLVGANAQLRHLVYYHLDNGMLENALFFAGRLHAHEPRNGDAAHLLALCNIRLGRYKAAFDYARPRAQQPQHLGCAYVFAQACLGLERYDVGAQALEKARGLWAGRNHWNKHSDTSRRHVPDAAACYCLLGKLYGAHGDTKKAIEYYVESLKLNPFMWDAFTGLCDIGAVVRPQNIFKVTPEMLASISHSATNGHAPTSFSSHDNYDARNPFVSAPDADPFNTSTRAGGDANGLSLGGSSLLSKLNGSMPPAPSSFRDAETPTSNGQNIPDEDIMMGEAGGPVVNELMNERHAPDVPHAPTRKTRMQNLNAHEDPPRMRSMTTRARLKPASELNERADVPQPQWQNGHKRTNSGHSAHQAAPTSAPAADPSAAQPRRSTRLQSVQSGAHNMISGIRSLSSRNATSASREPEVRDRRELRKARATGTKGKTSSVGNVGRVVSGNRKPIMDPGGEISKADSRPPSTAPIAPPQKMTVTSDPRELEALEWLLDILMKIGSGYRDLSRFECVKAMEAFNSLPTVQRETPWVLAQMGKAYHGRAMYAEAEKVFLRLRERQPSYIEDMDIFSTVLWQQGKKTELAFLAHTLSDQDRLAPETWVALGNAFSLEREHDQAIKCFTRAIQLDPKFAYAYTLQGHEHMSNEELDKASFAFRCAISADSRHYNGWYGLGKVYEMQHKFEMAEKHYRAAFLINSNNDLLAMRIGSVLDRMKRTEQALALFDTAIRINPQALQARVKRGHILLKMGSPKEALAEYLFVKDAQPDDANIHLHIGQAYKKLRNKREALKYFTICMNLDPMAQRFIKETMETWDEDDVAEWSSDDEGP